MSTENMHEQPKGQFNNSIWYITAGGMLLVLPFFIGMVWMTNALLPATDAQQVKELLYKAAQALLVAIGGGGPVALFVRSLMLTNGKIDNQRVNRDSSQSLGDVAKGAVIGAVASAATERIGDLMGGDSLEVLDDFTDNDNELESYIAETVIKQERGVNGNR